jgi:hypothetical protein
MNNETHTPQDKEEIIAALVAQRDELAAALREVTESLALEVNPECEEIIRARAALAKLK